MRGEEQGERAGFFSPGQGASESVEGAAPRPRQPRSSHSLPLSLSFSSASPHLVRQLPGVADDDGADLAVDRLQLLQHGQDKDGGLAHARLGLAQDVHAQDGLGDALVLDCGERGREAGGRRGRERGGGGERARERLAPRGRGWAPGGGNACWWAGTVARPRLGTRPCGGAATPGVAAPPAPIGHGVWGGRTHAQSAPPPASALAAVAVFFLHRPPPAAHARRPPHTLTRPTSSLTFRRVLKTAVHDGTQQLGLEQEVLETGTKKKKKGAGRGGESGAAREIGS